MKRVLHETGYVRVGRSRSESAGEGIFAKCQTIRRTLCDTSAMSLLITGTPSLTLVSHFLIKTKVMKVNKSEGTVSHSFILMWFLDLKIVVSYVKVFCF